MSNNKYTGNYTLKEMKNALDVNILVIGAGIYGLHVAELLKRNKIKHQVVAKEMYLDYEEQFYGRANEKISMASIANQARVHLGYHYPRSMETVDSCLKNFNKFTNEFKEELIEPDTWNHLYGLADDKENKTDLKNWNKLKTKINGLFKEKDLPEDIKFKNLQDLVNTNEKAVDTFRMMERKTYNYLKSKNGETQSIILDEIESTLKCGQYYYFKLKSNNQLYKARYIFNCTYSGLKEIEKIFDQETDLDVKYQLCELALFASTIAEEDGLNGNALTVMDGPFASIMPFCYRNSINSKLISTWSLTSVCHTPHLTSLDFDEINQAYRKSITSKRAGMIETISKFTGDIDFDTKYKRSIYTIKTISNKVNDDGRCVEIHHNYDNTFFSILSGKLSAIYELNDFMKEFVIKYKNPQSMVNHPPMGN